MIKDSFIVGIFLKIFNFCVSVLKGSFIWNLLSKGNNKFNNSVDKSSIVNLFSSKTQIDNLYGNRYSKLFLAGSGFFKKMFLWLANSVRKSKIVEFAAELCENFATIPLKFPGLFLLAWGLLALVGSFVTGAKLTASIICGAVFITGAIFLLLNKSVCQVLAGSFLFGKFVNCNKDINLKMTYKPFLISGMIAGILSSIFGILPVIACVVLFVVIAVGFYFTWQVAVLYVCVLPFMPTMVMVGLILFTFLSMLLKLCYDKNFKFTKTNIDVFIT